MRRETDDLLRMTKCVKKIHKVWIIKYHDAWTWCFVSAPTVVTFCQWRCASRWTFI